jgi:hypothetical protein
MATRKSYREYKQDSFVKVPALAWLLDRSLLYISVIVIGVLALGWFGKLGLESLARSSEDYEEPPIYQSVVAATAPGASWAIDFAATAPEGVSAWTSSGLTRPVHIVPNESCSTFEAVPSTLLATADGAGAEAQLRVQAYSSGQAAAQFSRYSEKLAACKGATLVGTPEGEVIQWDNTFVFTRGDALVAVTAPDTGLRDQLRRTLSARAEESLLTSGCLSIASNKSAVARNLYANPDGYEGFHEKTSVETEVSIANLPTPTLPALIGVISNPPQLPEGPLPENFPQLPTATVQKPTLPIGAAVADSFRQDADYLIADEEGPGCGWAWSGLSTPVYDYEKLEAERTSALAATQEAINGKAAAYVTERLAFAREALLVAPQLNRWNAHAQAVNTVYSTWNDLLAARERLRGPWYSYVTAHDQWRTWEASRAQAETEYTAALAACEAAETEAQAWDARYSRQVPPPQPPRTGATPTPAPTPTSTVTPAPSTPPRPEGCSTPPQRPSILTNPRPAEPTPPTIPGGVTLPASWPKPAGN